MATANLQVGASLDDSVEDTDSGTNNPTAIYHPHYNVQYKSGYRFQAVPCAQGATINTAAFQFKFTTTSYDDLIGNVHGEDIDDAPAFTANNSDISNRTQTTASTNINISGGGVGWQSVSVVSAIQEVVNRGGWNAGNDIVLLINTTDAASVARIISYDGTAADAAKLDLDYTDPAGGLSIPVAIHHYRALRTPGATGG